MNHMLPHQERVVTERAELSEKINKLLTFLTTDTFKSLPEREQYLLNRQVSHMGFYLDTLDERIALFNQPAEPDFLAGSKACDLTGDGTCEACQ